LRGAEGVFIQFPKYTPLTPLKGRIFNNSPVLPLPPPKGDFIKYAFQRLLKNAMVSAPKSKYADLLITIH
jgi:hypothetical protein